MLQDELISCRHLSTKISVECAGNILNYAIGIRKRFYDDDDDEDFVILK